MSPRNSRGITEPALASDPDRIEAARLTAERLVDLLVRIPEIDRLLGAPRPAVTWAHTVDSLGGITSEASTTR